MRAINTVPLKRLESRTPHIFLVAGALFVWYTGLKMTRLVTEIPVPDIVSVISGHLGLLALALAFLGFYPQVRSRTPWLARVGVVSSMLSGVCSVILLVAVLHLTLSMGGYPAIPEDTAQGFLSPVIGGILLLFSLLTILLGSLLFGVASLRSNAVSDQIGYLLLVPSLMWFLLFVMHAVGVNGTLIGVIVYPPIAAAVLTCGVRLRTENASTGPLKSLTDSPI